VTGHEAPKLLSGFVPWLLRTVCLAVALGVILFLAWLGLGFL
jgi:hypothetical protein